MGLSGLWSGGEGLRGNKRRKRSRASILEVRARGGGGSRTHRVSRVGVVLVLTAAAALAVWLSVVGFRQVKHMLFSGNPMFTIRVVDISTDGRIAPHLLRSYAGVREGDNLFAVDVREVRENLAAVPLVRDVRVQRTLPDSISVRVMERVPLARILMPVVNLELAVDSEGWVLGPGSASAALPLLTGFATPGLRPGVRLASDEIRDALSMLDLCDRTRLFQYVPIREVSRSDPETFVLRLARGEEVLMPRSEMRKRILDLSQIVRTIQSSRMQTGVGVRIDMTGDISYSATGLMR